MGAPALRMKPADISEANGAEARPATSPAAPLSPANPPPTTPFDIAVERTLARYPEAEWALMEPSRRTDAIYAELRRLDAEMARRRRPGSAH